MTPDTPTPPLSNISVKLLDYYGCDRRPVLAARVSTLLDDMEPDQERDLKLARYLLEHGHTSPYEHCGATFIIEAPIYAARQIMRHRTFSYNEMSRRYTSDDVSFYAPQRLYQQHERRLQCSSHDTLEPAQELALLDQLEAHYQRSLDLYHDMLEQGVSREQARLVLPVAQMTKFYMSGNLLNYIKFLRLRLDSHSQRETRLVAHAMYLHLAQCFPQIMHLCADLGLLGSGLQSIEEDAR